MLKVTLLGTGGTQPLPDRALAAAAVTVGGRSVLLDCGEGTQVGLRRYGVSAYRLSAVLLTHYHGDHILGLPGLLQTLGSLNRTEPLTIYGPPGIEPVAQAVTALAGPPAYPAAAMCSRCPAPGGSTPQGRGLRASRCPTGKRCRRANPSAAARRSRCWGRRAAG